MPYDIRKEDDKFCVFNKDTGKTVKCHPTEEKAENHMAALYANVPDAKTIWMVKAVGDWTLDVLGVPYGGPHNGKDSDGEYFSPLTELHEDKYGLPPVVYYHGFGPDGKPMGKPEYIGRTVSFEDRPDGRWYKVILDKASKFAMRVWQAAKEQLAFASSGSTHLHRIARDGHILEWPVAELSVFDKGERRLPANNYAVALPSMKSVYQQAGLALPDGFELEPKARARGAAADEENPKNNLTSIRGIKMSKEEFTEAQLDAMKKEAVEEGRKQLEDELQAKQDRQDELDNAASEAVAKARADWEEETEKKKEDEEADAIKARRLSESPDAPELAKHADIWKYDNLSMEDQAVLCGILDSAGKQTPTALKALAVKALENKEEVSRGTKLAMKKAGIPTKANELMFATSTGYGLEWVGTAYSDVLWRAIRLGTFVLDKMPQIEVPPGHSSIYIPIESTDPSYYKVSEATAGTTAGPPNATITSSRAVTARKQLTLSKMGARVQWSGEMQEDSLIPFVGQLRQQLQDAGSEQLESTIIDGDTATATTTNINDIGKASAQAGTELYLMFNGFRKSPLVTTTANARAGGTLSVEDFLDTIKLMGTGGQNAMDHSKITFIPDINVYWQALELEEVKTRDVFSGATLEDGHLVRIWGIDVKPSVNMHRLSSDRKVDTAGKVDQTTTTNNTTGSLLAVRWDQWRFGWRRRMTVEVDRIARADSYEIVALMRCGMVQRDTEAAAISYGLAV